MELILEGDRHTVQWPDQLSVLLEILVKLRRLFDANIEADLEENIALGTANVRVW